MEEVEKTTNRANALNGKRARVSVHRAFDISDWPWEEKRKERQKEHPMRVGQKNDDPSCHQRSYKPRETVKSEFEQSDR